MVSKARKIAAKAAIPISQFLAGTTGGLASVELVEPSEEFRAGPLIIEQSVGTGIDSTFLDEQLFRAPPFRVEVGIKLIGKNDYPKAIDEINQIYNPQSGGSSPEHVKEQLSQLYEEPFQVAVKKLAAKTLICFVAGSSLSIIALQQIPPIKKRIKESSSYHPLKNTIRVIGISAAAGILATGTTAVQINPEDIGPRVEEIVSAPIEEYLLTGTSKLSADFNEISNEISKHLMRIYTLEDAIRSSAYALNAEPAENKRFLIVSDSHNLPSGPMLIEALARAGDVDGIILMGDFLNTGAQFEVDSLSGFTIGDTSFQGFDDIKKCAEYIEGECRKENGNYPMYALTGNHDTKNLLGVLTKMGIKDFSTDPPAIFEGQLAVHDACYVDDDSCMSAHSESNESYAETLRSSLWDSHNGLSANVGFFANKAAGDVFEDDLDLIFTAGTHEYSGTQKNGSTRIEIGTVGSGFPRGAKYSNAVIAEFTRDKTGHVTMTECTSMIWDLFDSGSNNVESSRCL